MARGTAWMMFTAIGTFNSFPKDLLGMGESGRGGTTVSFLEGAIARLCGDGEEEQQFSLALGLGWKAMEGRRRGGTICWLRRTLQAIRIRNQPGALEG